MPRALYIHIPFCEHICAYCDFCKVLYREDFAVSYIDSLIEELKSYKINEVSSIYIGGGTPSSLSLELLDKLLSSLDYLLQEGMEFTVESNISNLTYEKLMILKKHGVNRLSLGVQSFDPNVLKLLNRRHNKKTISEGIKLAKKCGFTNINVDLIYGLPNSDMNSLKNDLEEFIKLDINHISTYSLTVNKGTLFFNKGIKEVSDELSREYYDYILTFLRKHGFVRYEVSNFAKPSFESKHNLVYWRDEEYYGLGLGASFYLDNVRGSNTKSLTKYLKGERIASKEYVSLIDNEEYYLMLKLRLDEGFSLNEFYSIFHHDFLKKYKEEIDELMTKKLLFIDCDTVKASDEGIMLLDYLLVHLLKS